MGKIPSIPDGVYEHYKGGRYRVIAVALHSETQEPFVVYCSISAPEQFWVRPFEMFTEEIAVGGRTIPRFRLIDA